MIENDIYLTLALRAIPREAVSTEVLNSFISCICGARDVRKYAIRGHCPHKECSRIECRECWESAISQFSEEVCI